MRGWLRTAARRMASPFVCDDDWCVCLQSRPRVCRAGKGWDPKKHEAAMSRQQERVRGESAMVREDFDCELLLGRLREHVAFSRRIAESAEERRRAREEAGKGPIAVEMR